MDNDSLEKVIRGLNVCDGHAIYTGHGCENCPYLEGTESGQECVERLHSDALALLKSQQARIAELEAVQTARVMTFDELEDTIADRAVWYEAFLTRVPTIAIVCEKSIADDAYTIVDFISGRHRVTRQTYGAAWRCWTSRPTDEQREAVAWER